jgi:PleD family two-component response regulator
MKMCPKFRDGQDRSSRHGANSEGTGGENMKKQKEKKKDVVLLIEDEQDIADLIRLHLEKSMMSVVHVRDGRQAVSMMENIAPPRAVLLDMVVPTSMGSSCSRPFTPGLDGNRCP